MAETFLSFYLKTYRLHLFVDSLRRIGSPRFIRFMISDDGTKLIIEPYEKKDFHSHRVPNGLYTGACEMELSSMRLCNLLSEMHHWEKNGSYRVPGTILPRQQLIVFSLDRAEPIKH